MPHPYIIDGEGNLIWNWEEERMANYKLYKKISKTIKKDTKIKCDFCGRDITNRIYAFKKGERKFRACSGCKFLFNAIYEEIISNRFDTIRNMLTYGLLNKRHCTCCKHFSVDDKRRCKSGKYTGLGRESTSSYPLSYANHGCQYFEPISFRKYF